MGGFRRCPELMKSGEREPAWHGPPPRGLSRDHLPAAAIRCDARIGRTRAPGAVARSGGRLQRGMSRRSDRPAVPFTAPERDLLRRELCRHFGQDPLIADGIFLRTWRGGSGETSRKSRPPCRPCWSAVCSSCDHGQRTARVLHRRWTGGVAAARARSPRHGPGAFRASAGRARVGRRGIEQEGGVSRVSQALRARLPQQPGRPPRRLPQLLSHSLLDRSLDAGSKARGSVGSKTGRATSPATGARENSSSARMILLRCLARRRARRSGFPCADSPRLTSPPPVRRCVRPPPGRPLGHL